MSRQKPLVYTPFRHAVTCDVMWPRMVAAPTLTRCMCDVYRAAHRSTNIAAPHRSITSQHQYRRTTSPHHIAAPHRRCDQLPSSNNKQMFVANILEIEISGKRISLRFR